MPGLQQWSPVGQEALYQTEDDVDKGLLVPRSSKVVAFDPEDDLALLVTAKPPAHTSAPVADGIPPVGSEVHVVGHPLRLAWTYTHGYVVGYRYDEDDKITRLQLDVIVHPGNSGGGAFDSEGRLVGICSFLIADQPGLSFFVGPDLINPFLVKARSERK